jgi:hypothetical protein
VLLKKGKKVPVFMRACPAFNFRTVQFSQNFVRASCHWIVTSMFSKTNLIIFNNGFLFIKKCWYCVPLRTARKKALLNLLHIKHRVINCGGRRSLGKTFNEMNMRELRRNTTKSVKNEKVEEVAFSNVVEMPFLSTQT